MRKIIIALSIVVVCISLVIVVAAHQGRTDGRGGHTNHSTGEYHYHHGYPEHDHYDMDGDGDIDCPYTFDDKTNHDSQVGNNDKIYLDIEIPTFPELDFTIPSIPYVPPIDNTNNNLKSNVKDESSKGISFVDILEAVFVCLFPAIAIGATAAYLLSLIFIAIWGDEKGCSISFIPFIAVSIIAYIWLIYNHLS